MTIRTEVLLSLRDAHLDDVLLDAPNLTGQRYCMNSASSKLLDEFNLPKANAEGRGQRIRHG